MRDGCAFRGRSAAGAENRRDLELGRVAGLHKVLSIDFKRIGNAIEPAHRYGSRARFEASDGLCGGGRNAPPRDIVEGQSPRPAHFPDTRDHVLAPKQN